MQAVIGSIETATDQVEEIINAIETIGTKDEVLNSVIKENKLSRTERIKIAKLDNVREDRESKQIKSFRPFGDTGIWDFKVWPRKFKAMKAKDRGNFIFVSALHLASLYAPFCYSAGAFKMFFAGYVLCALGITFSFHRQLTHKAFKSPKWFEYLWAYIGSMALQGDPMEWCSGHRHHHAHCDTEADPHSPKDGLFWSHAGWMFQMENIKILEDSDNVYEMKSQPFYQHMKKYYFGHVVGQGVACYLLGGLPGLIWGYCLKTVWLWHVTWAVNSVCHVWGRQMWNSGDISMNNPVIGVLAMGEGWHNNHHAFEDSCRHGLKWW